MLVFEGFEGIRQVLAVHSPLRRRMAHRGTDRKKGSTDGWPIPCRWSLVGRGALQPEREGIEGGRAGCSLESRKATWGATRASVWPSGCCRAGPHTPSQGHLPPHAAAQAEAASTRYPANPPHSETGSPASCRVIAAAGFAAGFGAFRAESESSPTSFQAPIHPLLGFGAFRARKRMKGRASCNGGRCSECHSSRARTETTSDEARGSLETRSDTQNTTVVVPARRPAALRPFPHDWGTGDRRAGWWARVKS